jgi:hypothetical protein
MSKRLICQYLLVGVGLMASANAARAQLEDPREHSFAGGPVDWGVTLDGDWTAPRSGLPRDWELIYGTGFESPAFTGGSTTTTGKSGSSTWVVRTGVSIKVAPNNHVPAGAVAGWETTAPLGDSIGIANVGPQTGEQHIRQHKNLSYTNDSILGVWSPEFPVSGPGQYAISVGFRTNETEIDMHFRGYSDAGILAAGLAGLWESSSVRRIYAIDYLPAGPSGPGLYYVSTGANLLPTDNVYRDFEIDFDPLGATNYYLNGGLIYTTTGMQTQGGFGENIAFALLGSDNWYQAGTSGGGRRSDWDNFEHRIVAFIPEPASIALMTLGSFLMFRRGRRLT